MKKLIYICIAMMVFLPSCKKDEINKPFEENTILFRLNGEYFEINDNIFLFLSDSWFKISGGSKEIPSISISLSGRDGLPPLGVGTYLFKEGIPYAAGLSTQNIKSYCAGYDELIKKEYGGTGEVTFSKYSDNYVEGTFEFASDYTEPFTVTGGYFKVRK